MRESKTKKSNLATKILPGWIERRHMRCGKPNCKCSRGMLHGPYFYHVTTSENLRFRRYIRRADVAGIERACQNHRELQAELLSGRASYKALLAQARELFRKG